MARIPFNIEFRPQIESGEYKVVTGDDRQVRIISWDKKTNGGRTDIVALIPTSQGDTETVQLYSPDGTLLASSLNEKYKLFIITPEPELTEFEADVMVILLEFVEEVDANDVKRISKELLEIAKKELDYEKEKALYCSYKIGLRDGKAEGYEEAMKEFKDLPALAWPPKIHIPSCPYNTGGCTNPMHDCISCPSYSIAGINTTTGTSAAKVDSHE